MTWKQFTQKAVALFNVFWAACNFSNTEPPRHSGDPAHGTENVAAKMASPPSTPTPAPSQNIPPQPGTISIAASMRDGDFGGENPRYAIIRGNDARPFKTSMGENGPVLKKGEIYIYDSKNNGFTSIPAAALGNGIAGSSTGDPVIEGSRIKAMNDGDVIDPAGIIQKGGAKMLKHTTKNPWEEYDLHRDMNKSDPRRTSNREAHGGKAHGTPENGREK